MIERIAEDCASGALASVRKPGGEGFDALAAERGIEVVTFSDWKAIEQAETARARDGAPREKFVDVAAMMGVRGA